MERERKNVTQRRRRKSPTLTAEDEYSSSFSSGKEGEIREGRKDAFTS